MIEVGPTLGGRIAQVGIVVPDLDRAVAGAEALGLMGTFRDYTMESSAFDQLIHRGSPGEMRFRVALNRSTPQVEFLQPLKGDSVYREFLDLNPAGGLHHFGFVVPDIGATIAAFAAAGIEPVFHGGGYGRAEDGAFAYFDTTEQLGYWVEAIEPPHPG
jgi:catechol 2,3-dioxygenase-like lactoylglutathione lyase family enzyme